ncbi:hypothetical protein B0H13DRAFT_1924773 [Mycena leptocephala]|nr:hypothetical protein B0H13DRAFT_1924773 [Mycena leptocephala]
MPFSTAAPGSFLAPAALGPATQRKPACAPALALYPSRPRLDPSFSLAGCKRDTTLYDSSDGTHSPAHLVLIDVDVEGDWDVDLNGGGVRVARRTVISMEMEMIQRMELRWSRRRRTMPWRCSARAGSAILKHGQASVPRWTGTRRLRSHCGTHGTWPWGMGLAVALRAGIAPPNTSVRLSSMHILLRKVARVVRLRMYVRIHPLSPPPFRSSVSTAADPLIERDRHPLQYANVRDVGVGLKAGWCEIAPTAHSASSEGPAYTVGSARSELRRIQKQSAPCMRIRTWVDMAYGFGCRCALARAVGGGYGGGECAWGYAYAAYSGATHDEPRHQNLAKTPPTPEEFLARVRDIDCDVFSANVVLNINSLVSDVHTNPSPLEAAPRVSTGFFNLYYNAHSFVPTNLPML